MEMEIEMETMKQQFEEFQKRMKAEKERENGNEGGRSKSTSTYTNSDSGQGNMEGALIPSVIQKLHIQHVELCKRFCDIGYIKGIIDELSMIQNFLRGKALDEVNHSIDKVMGMALYPDDIEEIGIELFTDQTDSIQRRLRETKWGMIKSIADGEERKAIISSVIQKLDRHNVEVSKHVGEISEVKGAMDELRMILDFLRDKGLAEVSRLRLDCLICEAIEVALYLDHTVGTFSLWEEATSIKTRLRGIKLRMLGSGVDGEDPEALILIVIEKLDQQRAEDTQFMNEEDEDIEGVMDELRMILDFLRDKGLAEVSRLRLDCLICEAIEVALYLDHTVGTFSLWEEATSIKTRLRGIKLRMLGSGVDGEDPEALILLVIEKLDRQRDTQFMNEEEDEDIEGVMDELRMILDLLREEKEKTDLINLRRHKYLICDLIEIALYLYNIKDTHYFRDLCKEAESVKSWLREIRLRMFKSSETETETETETRSEDLGEKGDVVGLDEQVKLVLGRAIFNEGKGLETAAITGMAGIGKTSLARQVYNHATVVDRFERRAWVCVSTHLTHKEILVKLIQQVVVDSSLILEEMDNRSLRHLLHDHLEGMPYLIVLDDLPKHMHLKSLLSAFPDGEDKGSRLLVTSSTKNIQTAIWYTHLVKPLDSDSSWKLFLNTIFRGNKFSSEHKFPKHLEEKGKETLRKCGGLPLAIKEVALQFAEKRRRGSEWEELLDSIDWGSTLALLENFYQQLEQDQKSCFLHLALFKENTTMRAEKLFNVLVSGGVVSESEMVACLIKLNRESVIDFKHMSGGNRLKSCDINVVLHRLSMKKAEEEIGFEILRNNNAKNPPSHTSPRHRIINCSREIFDYSTNQDEHLVSLFFRGGGSYLDATPSYWKSFELKLKILDLEDFGLKILPESIGTFIELRYLGLRNNYLTKLPHSLVCLKKLEVLDVAQNFMAEVPDIICDMSSLRRIYMSSAIFQKPLNIDTLKKLATVMYISVDDLICDLSSLQMMTILETEEIKDGLLTRTSLEELVIEEEDGLEAMTCLEELGIEEEDGLQRMTSLNRLGIAEVDANSDVCKLFASLAELNALEHLVLRGFRFRSMPCLDELRVLHSLTTLKLEGLLARLPSANDFPLFISYLRLVNTCLDEDPMPVLEQLPNLKHLKLKNAYTGRQMVIMSTELSRGLEVLCIEELWNLRNIQVVKGGLRWLQKLEIKNCPFLETLPEEIGAISWLEEFNMTTTKCIATKIRKSGSISKIRVVNISP